MCWRLVDSSEINLQAHQGRLKPEGVGVVGNNPTLVVESEGGLPLGLSTVQVWHRPAERPSKAERNYKRQPIEEKESYKWIESAAVTTYDQALSIIQWYRWRWHIEQLFAILKQRGLDIEDSQLESVTALQKLTVLALSVALQVLQLTLGRDHPEAEATVVLNPQQQACLEQLAPDLNGQTRKQQNPHPRFSLVWAAWLLARLGGWSGYQSQSPPGIVTFYRGLQTFEGIFLGWKLAHP